MKNKNKHGEIYLSLPNFGGRVENFLKIGGGAGIGITYCYFSGIAGDSLFWNNVRGRRG